MAKSKEDPKNNSFEKFKAMLVKRSDITEAPYNPRLMDEQNRKSLRNSLKVHGLIEPLVYNIQTKTLVGGHQRLSILDEENKYKDAEGNILNDYTLTVAAVDMSVDQEIEANIALNNPNSQGVFDLAAISNFDINHANAGFNTKDQDFFKQMRFEESMRNQPVENIIDQFEQMKKDSKAQQSPDDYTARTLAAKEVKQKAQTKQKETSEYITIILADLGQKNKLLQHWDLDPETTYITAETLFPLIELDEAQTDENSLDTPPENGENQ